MSPERETSSRSSPLLPTELLRIVITQALPQLDSTQSFALFEYYYRYLCAFRLVSRFWRDTIEGDPFLWAWVFSAIRKPLLRMVLHHSQNQDLHICIKSGTLPNYWRKIGILADCNLLKSLQPHSGRWGTLALHGFPERIRSLVGEHSGSLRELRVTVQNDDPSSSGKPFVSHVFNTPMHQLHSLVLHNLPDEWYDVAALGQPNNQQEGRSLSYGPLFSWLASFPILRSCYVGFGAAEPRLTTGPIPQYFEPRYDFPALVYFACCGIHISAARYVMERSARSPNPVASPTPDGVANIARIFGQEVKSILNVDRDKISFKVNRDTNGSGGWTEVSLSEWKAVMVREPQGSGNLRAELSLTTLRSVLHALPDSHRQAIYDIEDISVNQLPREDWETAARDIIYTICPGLR